MEAELLRKAGCDIWFIDKTQILVANPDAINIVSVKKFNATPISKWSDNKTLQVKRPIIKNKVSKKPIHNATIRVTRNK
jgi:1,2-phenylacetyl-CoA epoxidase PaaB subunit